MSLTIRIHPRNSWTLTDRKRTYASNRLKISRAQVKFSSRRVCKTITNKREDYWYLTHSYFARKWVQDYPEGTKESYV